MLKQNSNESDEPPAAQIRVKREEFARAISALEARRQAEAQFLEGTVAVEDTLRELQVDVSTEEVMQQIEAQRAGYVVEEKPRRVWDHDKITDFKLIGGIVLVPLFVILWCAMLYHPSAMPNVAAQTGSRPEALAWMPPPPMMSPGIVERQMDEGGFNASSVLKPLSQVADNEQVHCNSRSLGTSRFTATAEAWERFSILIPARLEPLIPRFWPDRTRCSMSVPPSVNLGY